MKLTPKTIRGQVATAFVLCFLFMAVMIGVHGENIHRLTRSMRFFALTEDVNSSILEMRRYEKNFFLHRQGFDYEENVTYTNNLRLILSREQGELVDIIGAENYRRFVDEVEVYSDLLTRLRLSACEGSGCGELETQIRGAGHNLTTLADQFVLAERGSIDGLLRTMVSLPWISLLSLVGLLLFIIFFIGERVIRPLARITREAEAVAKGAFGRITPYGNTKNEIHHLVSTINGMMADLEKRQEQLVQSRKIASIGTLTAGIAHEINNPVNNISLILESLIEQSERMDAEERRKLYRDAMDQADRTSKIVKNLLEFSRVGAGRIEDFSVVELIDKTARLVHNEMKLNKIRFQKVIEADLPLLHMDRGGMQQVMLNLFLNAIQAMERDGTLRVVVGLTNGARELRVDVIDDGPGIAPEHVSEIFDPFFTTKKVGMGTGLGLSVSYNIVRKNGGRMEVQGNPGRGACFSIFLPLTG